MVHWVSTGVMQFTWVLQLWQPFNMQQSDLAYQRRNLLTTVDPRPVRVKLIVSLQVDCATVSFPRAGGLNQRSAWQQATHPPK